MEKKRSWQTWVGIYRMGFDVGGNLSGRIRFARDLICWELVRAGNVKCYYTVDKNLSVIEESLLSQYTSVVASYLSDPLYFWLYFMLSKKQIHPFVWFQWLKDL